MAKTCFKKLQLRSSYRQIEKLETYLKALQQHLGIEPELFSRIRLATNEAVTNAVVHGNKQDNTKQVTVTVSIHSNILQISVQDEGDGFDPDALANPTAKDKIMATSGRGVCLVKHVAERVI